MGFREALETFFYGIKLLDQKKANYDAHKHSSGMKSLNLIIPTIAALLGFLPTSTAFSFTQTLRPAKGVTTRTSSNLYSTSSRRDVLSTSAAFATSLIMSPPLPSFAAAGGPGSDASKPIVVLGASGKTGRIIVDKLTSRSLHVLACTRSGSSTAFPSSPYLSQAACDVTSLESLTKAVSSASACVFAGEPFAAA